jgi:hypothetical protein
MCLWKYRPKSSPTHLLSKCLHYFYLRKSSQKTLVVSISFIKLPKVNNDPIGQNSPNLVTLSKSPKMFSDCKSTTYWHDRKPRGCILARLAFPDSNPWLVPAMNKPSCDFDQFIGRLSDKVLTDRVARFFLVQNTKTGKIFQLAAKYTKCP